ncbi:MAG: ferritin-like domain-containing protein [Deltaproteobacteria bacterium]|nr:ferritin-like domain-containing protein [Deltaproteobacteria bacterium]
MFAAIATATSLAGADAALVESISAARADEARHRELCAAIAQVLKASPSLDRRPLAARLAALPEQPLSRALALLAVEVAVGETVSCALFRAGLDGAREPLTRFALEAILRDEARHAALGWSALAALLPRSTVGGRAALHEELRQSLGLIEQTQARPALERLERGEPFDPALVSLGVLAPEARVEAFYDGLARRALPALAAPGLDGSGAWRRRYTAEGQEGPEQVGQGVV